jgi:hypothetical protein
LSKQLIALYLYELENVGHEDDPRNEQRFCEFCYLHEEGETNTSYNKLCEGFACDETEEIIEEFFDF